MSPAGLAISDPALAAVLIGIEALAATAGALLLITTLTLAALRGSETTSERAFRLLCLLGDRPEQRPVRPARHPDAIATADTDSRPAS